MKVAFKLIMIIALVGVVAFLILTKGCGRINPLGKRTQTDIELIYDSLERVIKSKIPPPDTIKVVEQETVTRWLPSAIIMDTVYIDGNPIYVYNDREIDTNAILTHYLTQSVTYIDTLRDSSLQAVISDTIFRNKIVGRGFEYKILRPLAMVDNRDKFQLIASFQSGAGFTYSNEIGSVYAGLDLGLKFKSGTYFSVGYMAGSGHFVTLRAGQVIRLRK